MRLGADPTDLLALAERLERGAGRLRGTAAELAGATVGVWWIGASRGRLDDAAGRCGRRLRQVAAALQSAADEVRAQARQQRAASGGAGEVALRTVTRRPGARLLDVDPRGDGRIVAAVGDPDRAEVIVVLVPGAGSSLASTESLLGRAEAVREATAAHRGGPVDEVAVVAWLGYDAPGPFDDPDDVVALLTDDAARTGGRALRRFLRRLGGHRVTSPRRVALVGHSYGSLVAARAARGNATIDALVVVGSPGLGVDRASDLGLAPDVEVVAGASVFDPVSRTSWFGRSPTDAGFGATTLDLTDRRPGRLGHRVLNAHSAYFEPGSPMLAALAATLARP